MGRDPKIGVCARDLRWVRYVQFQDATSDMIAPWGARKGYAPIELRKWIDGTMTRDEYYAVLQRKYQGDQGCAHYVTVHRLQRADMVFPAGDHGRSAIEYVEALRRRIDRDEPFSVADIEQVSRRVTRDYYRFNTPPDP